MAGPYTGAWLQNAIEGPESYATARKWGTGINPIHSQRMNYADMTPKLLLTDDSGPPGQDTASYADESNGLGFPATCPEDSPDLIWGYGTGTGTSDRPPWKPAGNPQRSAIPDNYPSWGGSRKVGPAGTFIRSLIHGSRNTYRSKQVPNETVSEGWTNKTHGIPGDARASDDSQIFMQTSDVQRYKTRAGSQNVGSQSEYTAPISSRVVGQKLKHYSGQGRHYDMTPYEQNDIPRAFLSRQAGTGYPEWMAPNEMFVNEAMQREPGPDPDPGPTVDYESDNYGYVGEDVIPYA